jgi:hypothetical protein
MIRTMMLCGLLLAATLVTEAQASRDTTTRQHRASTGTTQAVSMDTALAHQVDRITKALWDRLALSEEQAGKVHDILKDLSEDISKADQDIRDVLTNDQKRQYADEKWKLFGGRTRASSGERRGEKGD